MSAGSDILLVLKKYPLAIACSLVFVVGLVLIFTRGDELGKLVEQEATLDARIKVMEQNTKNAVDLEAQLEEVRSSVEEMRSRLFKSEERAVNANFFYGMEAAFGVRITSINQQPGGYEFYNKGGIHELKGNSTMVYQISLVGQLSDILSFAHQLTKVRPFMRVTNLQISRGNQVADALDCSLSVAVLSELE